MSLTFLTGTERSQPLPARFLEQGDADCAAPASEPIGSGFSLDRTLGLGAPQIHGLLVDDDNLLGFGLYPGDRLIVDRSATPVVDQYLVVRPRGAAEYSLRLLAPDPRGGLLLKAARPSIPSLALDDPDSIEIWGVVLWVVSYVGRKQP
ncbi:MULTISPECIES: S24 family peptidase [Pseudomonas]|uniref:S24 family peptidase n=1 Tax=Pseudomonas TaxID=286 RepID=UPI0018EB996F|nr:MULTISPECIES: S24 family peptidase [Pseudomonas]MDF2397015.1 S24 family peptidase [Pseudomonas sp. 3MA1]MDP9527461.1 S24 family peptidase [Pseudomonas protegens]